jgi:uncharacterized coiled-coil protein SlyX
MSHSSEQTIINLAGKQRPVRKGQALITIVLVLASLACHSQLYAVDPTDTFYGTGAGASTTTGTNDSAFGYNALNSNTTGNYNTASGANALVANTIGNYNTASGANALLANTTGYYNTASGSDALHSNTIGIYNTASGFEALYSNTGGSVNTASGAGALYSNTTGNANTASGSVALYFNTTGNSNTATGRYSLYQNTTGDSNTASGFQALYSNTTASYNNAIGDSAMFYNTTGAYNTAQGWRALWKNETGNFNAAFGPNALVRNTGSNNMAVGVNSLYNNTTGNNNIAIGFQAGFNLSTGSGNIDIGNYGVAGESNTTRIGTAQTRAFVAGVSGAVVSGGVPVYVSASGQLGTNPSSKRFKQDIADMDKQSEAILALHPVTFRYKDNLDPTKTAQFGLIAEEVAEVDPDLIAKDEKGEIYSVRYEAVNAMLLNEFLKNHRVDQDQEAVIDQLKTIIAQQEATNAKQEEKIEALNALVQKMRSQLELKQAALVADNQ